MEETDESPLKTIVNMLFAVFLFCFVLKLILSLGHAEGLSGKYKQ